MGKTEKTDPDSEYGEFASRLTFASRENGSISEDDTTYSSSYINRSTVFTPDLNLATSELYNCRVN